MKNDLVSIIIPVYNAEDFILETIKTVENQTYKNWELIMVDDLSTDKSKNIIENYIKKNNKSNIELISLEKKGMASGARNFGIEKAKGRYICFLDADDLWTKDKLKKQISFMQNNNCAFSFTGYEFADNLGIPKGTKVFVPEQLTYKMALKNTTIWTTTVMFDINKISKDLIKMPNIKSEDTATWWKILRNGYTAYGLNEILAFYRRSSGTLSSNKFEAIRRIWNLYRNYEKLNILYSLYNFIFYAFNAIKRRI